MRRLSLTSPWLLLAGPALMLLVFGVLRDVPPPAECGGNDVPQSVIDDYRAGSLTIFVVSELVTLAVYAAALRRSEHGYRTAPFLAAAAGLIVAVPLCFDKPTDRVVAGALLALAVASGVLLAIRRAVGAPWSWLALLLTVVIGLVALPVGLFLLFVASFLPGTVLGIAAVLVIAALSWVFIRESATMLVSAATFMAVAGLPLAFLVIQTRGDQPLLC